MKIKNTRAILAALCVLVLVQMPASLFAQIPSGYYNSASGLTGAALATALHEIIDDHTRYPYTASTTDVWDILEAADQDPSNSANILDIYKNQSYPKSDHTNWNREHSWPKSLGFPTDGSCNYPYTDTHHLFASDIVYNSARSNKPFDNCNSGCTEYPVLNASSSNWTDTSNWEPYDDVKGDLARAAFYMAVRYNGGTHGITGCAEPDLRLTNDRSLIQTFSSNQSVGYMGLLSTLLAWHAADPVDGAEIARENVIFSFQGNRNPFVDHPEWVNSVFGGGDGSGGTTGGGGGGGGGGGSTGSVWINELHYDNNGTDTFEGVEVAGTSGTSLTGWSLVAYNGSGGASYLTVSLSGSLANQSSGFGTAWFAMAGLQNGAPDGIALVNASGTLVEFISYEGSFTATNGPASGQASTSMGVSEPGTTAAGKSLQLTGSGSSRSAFTWQAEATASRGAVNSGQSFTGSGGGGATALWINELHYDNSSTDVSEGVEVAGTSGQSLTGWQLVAYNGSTSTSYLTVNLTGTLTNKSNGFGMAWFAMAGLQNGAPDGIALVNPSGVTVEAISYEGSFTGANSPANGVPFVNIGVSEAGSTTGRSLQLGGTGNKRSDFTWRAEATKTEAGVNGAQTFTSALVGTALLAEDFEHSAKRQELVRTSEAFEGYYCLQLDKDAVYETADFDGSGYRSLTFSFWYRSRNLTPGEAMVVELRQDDQWVGVGHFVASRDFANETYQKAIVELDGDAFELGSAQMRVRSDVSANSDLIDIDSVLLTGNDM